MFPPERYKNGVIVASKTGKDVEIVFAAPGLPASNDRPPVLGAFANDVYLSTPHQGGNQITDAMNVILTNQAANATDTVNTNSGSGFVQASPNIYYAHLTNDTNIKILEKLAATQDILVEPYVAPSS